MSVWLAVDGDGSECITDRKPIRLDMEWVTDESRFHVIDQQWVILPKGTIIKKLIGRELTWADEPVEYKGDEE